MVPYLEMQHFQETDPRSLAVRTSSISSLQVYQQTLHSRKEVGSETSLRQEFEQARGRVLQEHLREQYKTQRQHTEAKRKSEDGQNLRRNTEIVCQAQEMADLRVEQIGQRTSPQEKVKATKELKAKHSRQRLETEHVMRTELAQCEDRCLDQWNVLLLGQARELDDLQRELANGLRKILEREG